MSVVPPGPSAVEQAFRTHLAVPYVLGPASRDRWDQLVDAGPAMRTGRRIARAFVAAREGQPGPLASLDWSDPAFIAVTLPCRWAVEFGLRAIEAGEPVGGRRLIGWLCEHWGDPARVALRSWTVDVRLGSLAASVLAETPMPPRERAAVSLLGATRLRWGTTRRTIRTGDANGFGHSWRGLSCIAAGCETTSRASCGPVSPSSERAATCARRSATCTACWNPAGLRATRGPVSTARSPTAVLDVDVWRFQELLAEADRAEHEGRVRDSLPLLVEAAGIYSGDLAPDLDVEWLDLERIHLRSRFVRASCRAAELLVAIAGRRSGRVGRRFGDRFTGVCRARVGVECRRVSARLSASERASVSRS